MNGKLYICATPIGNLSDITLRALEVLKSVDLIAAEDTRRTLRLLNHFGIEKPLTSYFEHNRKEKGEFLIRELKSGKDIALVSDAGTPAISDPGEELVLLCAREGVEVIPVPGAVAAICALVVSALPCSRFAFEGFLSVNRTSRLARLKSLENEQRTMIFYEAPHKLAATLGDMLSAWGDRKITLCRELTKLHEETVRTTLSEAAGKYAKEPPKGEFVLVVKGKDPLEIQAGEREKWESVSEKEHIGRYMKRGLTEKEAIRAAAKDRGIPKRELYGRVKRNG